MEKEVTVSRQTILMQYLCHSLFLICSYEVLTISLLYLEFKLGPEELERWFTKIDHIFEQTRIPPVGEVLTPFYKTSVKKLKQYDLPLISHINHKYVPLLL